MEAAEDEAVYGCQCDCGKGEEVQELSDNDGPASEPDCSYH